MTSKERKRKRRKRSSPLDIVNGMYLSQWFLLIYPCLHNLEDLVALQRVCKGFANHKKLRDLIKEKTKVVFGGVLKRFRNRFSSLKSAASFFLIKHNDKFICLRYDSLHGRKQIAVFPSKDAILSNIDKVWKCRDPFDTSKLKYDHKRLTLVLDRKPSGSFYKWIGNISFNEVVQYLAPSAIKF